MPASLRISFPSVNQGFAVPQIWELQSLCVDRVLASLSDICSCATRALEMKAIYEAGEARARTASRRTEQTDSHPAVILFFISVHRGP